MLSTLSHINFESRCIDNKADTYIQYC